MKETRARIKKKKKRAPSIGTETSKSGTLGVEAWRGYDGFLSKCPGHGHKIIPSAKQNKTKWWVWEELYWKGISERDITGKMRDVSGREKLFPGRQ